MKRAVMWSAVVLLILGVAIVMGLRLGSTTLPNGSEWKLSYDTTTQYHLKDGNASFIQISAGKLRYEIDSPVEVTAMVISAAQLRRVPRLGIRGGAPTRGSNKKRTEKAI